MNREYLTEDGTVFSHIFGNSANARIIDFFIENKEEEWNLTEVKDGTGTMYSKVKRVIPEMLENNFLTLGRKVGKSQFYKLNNRNTYMKHLLRLHEEIDKELESEYLQKLKKKVVLTVS